MNIEGEDGEEAGQSGESPGEVYRLNRECTQRLRYLTSGAVGRTKIEDIESKICKPCSGVLTVS